MSGISIEAEKGKDIGGTVEDAVGTVGTGGSDLSTASDGVRSGKTNTLKLVSGLTLLVSKFKVKHEDIWSDRDKMYAGGMEDIFEDITIKVVDPGPYSETGVFKDGVLDWSRVLTGDRVDLLVQNRIKSYRHGNEYWFDHVCPKCQAAQDDTFVDLLKLKRRELSADSRAKLISGGPFVADLMDADGGAKFLMQTGADERKLMDMERNGQIDKGKKSAELIIRVKSIDGIAPERLVPYIREDMTSDDACDLRNKMDEVDCGIDTSVFHKCWSCKSQYWADVPFDQGFLSPQREIAKRRKAMHAEEGV